MYANIGVGWVGGSPSLCVGMNVPNRPSQFAAAASSAPSAMSRREFVALIASLMALTALSVDIMLPSLPLIGDTLGLSNANDRQTIIVVFLLGFAAGQLVFGRLSDLYGRKLLLFVGLAIFVGGSALAALAWNAESMLLARLTQGLGAAAPRVIAIALVRDRSVGREMARLMSIALAVFFTVPVLGPTVGEALLLVGSWRLAFDFLIVCGLILGMWSSRLPVATPSIARVLSISQAIRAALRTPQTIGYAVGSGLMFGCVLAYISSAQQIFVDVFEIGALFPLAFAAIAAMIAAASLTNAVLVERFGMRRLSHMSLAAFVALAATLVAEVVAGLASFPVFLATMMPLFLLFGFVAANFNAMAMEPQGDNAGMAASVVGSISTGLGAVSGGIVGHLFDGTVLPLAVGLLTLSVLALLGVAWIEGVSKLFRSGDPNTPLKSEGEHPLAELAQQSIRVDWAARHLEGEPSMSTEMPRRPRSAETKVVHAARAPHSYFGFVNPPVFRGSTVLFPTAEKFVKGDQQYTYGRMSTPTVRGLEEAIAEIEGGAACTLTGSGYQAVCTAILAFVKTGDHILMVDSVYQPTRRFCDDMLAKLGVETTFYDPLIGARIADLIRPNTKLIFTESPGSQTFEVQDIPTIARVAAERGLWLLLDNTWASPLYFKPFEHGVDVSIQAATKYIVGHADAILGAITSNARATKHITRAKELLGVCPGSEETYLGMRGLRTLPTRLMQHHRSALVLAQWLERRPEVARVLYPALPSHPQHALWKRDFLGASGLFSIVLKPVPQQAVWAMLDGLTLFGIGLSWGGYESLVIPFDASSYRTATKWQPEGPTLRIHVGLEDVEELCIDLKAGFERLMAASNMVSISDASDA